MEEKKIKMRLCGQDVEVLFCDKDVWENNDMGRSDVTKCRIIINKELPQTSLNSTLLHEVLHYITETNGFSDESEDEKLISVIANSLLAWMRDNKDIILEILE